MVLVLALGDLHIPHRAPDLPAKFKSMLVPGKIQHILCTGNLCIKVIPWGDLDSLTMLQRQLGVDILVTGHTHQFTAYKHEGGVVINPGSATGAYSSITYDVNPSFVLMDIDGLRVVVYVYELIDGEVKLDFFGDLIACDLIFLSFLFPIFPYHEVALVCVCVSRLWELRLIVVPLGACDSLWSVKPPKSCHASMPPKLPYSQNLKNTRFLIQPIIHQLPITVSTDQNPSLKIPTLLPKCKDKTQLEQIHAHIITTGLIQKLSIVSKLVASFASICTTTIAKTIADKVPGLDTYTWNTIIRGYLEEKKPEDAILAYTHLRRKGLKADSYTLLYVIKSCGLMQADFGGEQIHCHTIKMGFESEVIIQTALIQMYGLCDMWYALEQLFDEMPQRDIIVWNTLITAYAQGKFPYNALQVIHDMLSTDVKPNGVTVVSALSACSCLKALRYGKVIHGYLIRNLSEYDVFVHNSLIDLYANCGSLMYAHRVFQVMPTRNVVSWTSMIKSYSDNDCPSEALAIFKLMISENITVDEITLLGVISLCSKLGSFELAMWIDNYVQGSSMRQQGMHMSNALIDMHSKCGNIKKACEIFKAMEDKTIVSWTAIIQGLALHGHGLEALIRFNQMLREGLKPDSLVFLSILSACSHSGLVDEGRKCFASMINDYGLEPWREHYGCMVDLLCRAGLVGEAFEFVKRMQTKADRILWRMLLRACQSQGNIGLANQVMEHLQEGGENNIEDYTLFSNLYATTAAWDNVNEIRKKMETRGFVKLNPGCSHMETN
ncbi:Pentatricopeptide repeat [Dillenia turbinata]|uniref:Pentatricopeptide repeat n=1 Tax=Dillenia turbinata TaxID=194707 RepID=A0AAN8V916_9MAGN